jgi:hypothetical protein
MPRVAQAYKAFATRDVFFLGVCGDTDRTIVDRYIEEHGITWPQTMDDTDLCKSFGVGKFPAAFVLDESGAIQWAVHPASLDVALQRILSDKS